MSSINKYNTRNIQDVNSQIRSSLERKRSEVMLRLSELDEAVKPERPPHFPNKTTNDKRPKTRLSGAQRRKLGIERALAIGAPILPRKRRRPRALETTTNSNRIKTRLSPKRASIARPRSKPIIGVKKSLHSTNTIGSSSRRNTIRTNRSSRSPNRNYYPTSDKYDPAFPTPNESIRNKESLRHNSAPSRENRSRSPFHRSRPDKFASSPGRRDVNRSPIRRGRNLSPGRRGENHRSRSPARLERNRRSRSPHRLERNRKSRSPGRLERIRHHKSPDRLERSHNTGRSIRSRSADRRARNHSPRSHPSTTIYGNYRPHESNTEITRDNKLNSNYHSSRKDRDPRRHNTSITTRVDDFSANQHTYADMVYNFDIPTNYTNELVDRSLDINGRYSHWQDSSLALNSYSQSNDYRPGGDIRIFDQIDRNKYSNNANVHNITSNKSDPLRSRDSDQPLRSNTRTNEGVPSYRNTSTSSSHRPSDPSKINTDLIRLSIVPVDFPKTTLTKSQADDIELSLISHIKPGKAGTGPQFSYISFSQRTLIAGCKNLETKHWLEDVVPKLQVRNVGPLKILSTKELARFEKLPKVTMFVPNPIAKKSASTLLTLLKTQNVGLETENWRILGSNDKPGGLSMALLIDTKSLATLEKLDLKACLGLTQAKFTIIRGK